MFFGRTLHRTQCGVETTYTGTSCLLLVSIRWKSTAYFNPKLELVDGTATVVVDMPETATLETTDGVVRELESYLRTLPEVTDFTSTVGSSSPMDFNGLVRHYYLRQGPHVADIRVSLLPRNNRKMASHSIILRIRNDVAAIGRRAF